MVEKKTCRNEPVKREEIYKGTDLEGGKGQRPKALKGSYQGKAFVDEKWGAEEGPLFGSETRRAREKNESIKTAGR